MLGKLYNIFGIGTLQSLHLGISTLLNVLTFEFRDSDMVIRKPGAVERQGQPLNGNRVSIRRDVNSSIAAIFREASVLDLHVDLSIKACSMQFGRLFLNSGALVVLKDKDYRSVYAVFLIIEAYIKRATGFLYDANMTCFRRTYSNIVSKVVSQNYS